PASLSSIEGRRVEATQVRRLGPSTDVSRPCCQEIRLMGIAYGTTDEVNEHLAEQMAAACGLTLYPLAPKDAPSYESFDAVLYDWDYWPVEQQQEALAELLVGRLPHAVAVHGYNLEDGLAEALRLNGVAVYRRLQPRVFHFLRRAIRVVHAAKAAGRHPQDQYATSQHRGGAC